ALEGLMQVLADEQEGTSEIRVNSINPGATRTAMRKAAYPAEEPEKNPEPADIMPAFLYLLGPDSQKVNGQALDARGCNDRPRRTGASERLAAPIAGPGHALAYRACQMHVGLAQLTLLYFLLRHADFGQTHRRQSDLGAE